MTAAQRPDPYIIKADPRPERYARGWYVIGASASVTTTPSKLRVFGQKLVAYRGEDGQAIVLDGYCPHMGGDLSEGEVKGNSVICPFHL